jgi:hypothetical protein
MNILYIFLWKGNESHELGTGFSIHKRIISAVKNIILRGLWCDIIIQNVHAPTENKIDDMKDRFHEELEHVFDKFPKCHTHILLRDINVIIGMEDIFKPTIGNASLHKISNDNGVRVVNFATSKSLTVKITMFPHCQSQSHIATDGQSASKSWCRAPSGAYDQIFITV